jgi:hypothetical protein
MTRGAGWADGEKTSPSVPTRGSPELLSFCWLLDQTLNSRLEQNGMGLIIETASVVPSYVIFLLSACL